MLPCSRRAPSPAVIRLSSWSMAAPSPSRSSTTGRRTAFSHKVHKQLGKYELEDQIAGAQYLASLPYVDASRIGIYGHSYGGFMAALAMLEGHGVFQAG